MPLITGPTFKLNHSHENWRQSWINIKKSHNRHTQHNIWYKYLYAYAAYTSITHLGHALNHIHAVYQKLWTFAINMIKTNKRTNQRLKKKNQKYRKKFRYIIICMCYVVRMYRYIYTIYNIYPIHKYKFMHLYWTNQPGRSFDRNVCTNVKIYDKETENQIAVRLKKYQFIVHIRILVWTITYRLFFFFLQMEGELKTNTSWGFINISSTFGNICEVKNPSVVEPHLYNMQMLSYPEANGVCSYLFEPRHVM